MDEYAYDGIEGDIEPFVVFDDKEEAEAYERELSDGRILSEVAPYGDKWCRYHHIVGEFGVKAIRKAGEFYNYPIALDADYKIGDNWKDIH